MTGSVSKEPFADADFVIEAVFEELNVKKQVFAELEAIVSPDCILATNTSSLSVTAMAEDLSTRNGWWASTSSTRWPSCRCWKSCARQRPTMPCWPRLSSWPRG